MVFAELPLEFDATLFDVALCEEVLQKTKNYSQWHLQECLYIAGDEQEKLGNINDANILRLIAGAMSMRLDKVPQTDPFSAMVVYSSGAHTPVLEDFNSRDLLFFESIVDSIEDLRLKARIADILWSSGNENLTKYKRYELAEKAINAYMAMPLNPDTWNNDLSMCWARCAYLVMLYQGKGGNLKSQLELKLKRALFDDSVDSNKYLFEIAEIIDKNNLILKERIELAIHIEKIGESFYHNKEFISSIKCFNLAEKWYEKLGHHDSVAKLIMRQVDAYDADCENLAPLSIDRNMGNAINTLKRLKLVYRGIYHYKDKLNYLRNKMLDARDDAVAGMATYSQNINVYPYIQDAIKYVEKRDKWDAFFALMRIAHTFDKCKQEEKWILEESNKTGLLDVFPRVSYQEGNRHLCVSQAYIEDDTDKKKISDLMMRQYKYFVGFNAISRILPALDVIHAEHHFSERDFDDIVQNCPLIPYNRKKLFAKALYAGYEYDYAVAFHILSPQIEYMLCVYLRERGIDITIEKEAGREDDKSLGALLKMNETIELMGENICYELDSLFCNHNGFNIRNDVAHGKFSDDDWKSCTFAYVWWYILRLIFINSRKFYVWKLKM